MKIRQAKKRDLEQLYELEKNTFSEAEAASRESVERRLSTHRQTFWVIKEKGRIVSGINGITTNERDLCDEMYSCEDYYDKKGRWLMIFGVSTLEEYRHKGYATAIMNSVLQDVVRCRMDGIVLTCKEELLGFYEKFGFVDEGVCDSSHGGAVWHQMRLVKSHIKRRYVRDILEWGTTIAAAVIIATVLEHFVLLSCTVPTGSMQDTVQPGDDIIGSRLAYKLSDPQRGDIAIFIWPDDGETIYIKRIIGLPGETVEIKEGRIYIDGSDTPLEEDYLSDDARTDVRSFGPYKVPENCYFMLGDNRNYSADARFWNNTYVERDKILAKAELLYYPLSDIAWLGSGADYTADGQ